MCAEAEKLIAAYCARKNLTFDCVTAMGIVLDACKLSPITKTIYDPEKDEYSTINITKDVAWEYSGNKIAIERVQGKVEWFKQAWQQQFYNTNIAKDKPLSIPDLDKLVDALYQFNIMDGQSYLALVYFLMQLKYTRGGQEMPKHRSSQRISLFLNGIQGSGKSSMAHALINLEENYGAINYVNDAETFESRFEENLWKAHLNFCDEVVPSAIKRELLIRAIDGGLHLLDRKNKTPYNYNVNTNLIFASKFDMI